MTVVKTVKFSDYLEEQMKDPSFSEGYLFEDMKLKNALSLIKSREKAGLSQRELAKKASVSETAVFRVENGDNVTLETFMKIAMALGRTVLVK